MLPSSSSTALCAFLSLGVPSCAVQTDSKVGSGTDHGLGKAGVTVTPVEGDPTRASVDVVGADRVRDVPADAPPPVVDGAKAEPIDGGYVVTLPGLPPITVDADDDTGPRVVGVTRTDRSEGDGEPPPGAGPRVVDVTRIDHSQGGDGDGPPHPLDREPVVVKRDDGTTTIAVPGFPAITLTPVADGIEVNMPGTPPFRIPKGAIIEAPGGIRIGG